jgi:hypothetical protein
VIIILTTTGLESKIIGETNPLILTFYNWIIYYMIVIINSYNIEEIGIKKKINTRKEIIIKIIIF